MNTSDFKKKNGRYFLKYINSESYYKNSLLLDSLQFFKHLMKGKLLDLGCGNKPYYDIYSEVCEQSIGCDVPFTLHKNSHVEVLCPAEDIDKHFQQGYFDCIICTEVLEHTSDDLKVAENMNRVLKKNGTLIISAPFTYVLHEAPYDYRRYTLYGLLDILKKNQFEVKSAFSMGATFSSGFYIHYYAMTKIFFFTFKKIGLKNLQSNKFVNAVVSFPEFILYKLNKRSFRRKLTDNKFPSTNEMFSSLGYFIVAEKINDI